jgi:lipopolysaccharide/colanic/teichoic acid biosynthesis glycosyltransferase
MNRVVEIILASWAILTFAWFFIFFALAIYLIDGRPVIITEVSVDRRGRAINLLAFRTDRVEPDSNGDARCDLTLLPWVGRYLRCTGLYKLPRFWGVLKGDCGLDDAWF